MGCFSGGKWWCMSSRLLGGAGCTVGAARGYSTCWDGDSYWPTPIKPRASSSICEPFPVARVRAYWGSRLESLADCLSVENIGGYNCHANVTSFPGHFALALNTYISAYKFMLVFYSLLLPFPFFLLLLFLYRLILNRAKLFWSSGWTSQRIVAVLLLALDASTVSTGALGGWGVGTFCGLGTHAISFLSSSKIELMCVKNNFLILGHTRTDFDWKRLKV